MQMGLTVLRIEVGNPARPETTKELEFLIDSGAIYSVVPAAILESLGIALDPLKRELRPLPMILAGYRKPSA